MKIETGLLKGRRLAVNSETVSKACLSGGNGGYITRPTTSKAKHLLLNLITNSLSIFEKGEFEGGKSFKEFNVIDLYSGTGAVGFEMVSNGATSVVFVESSKKAMMLIEQSARSLGVSKQCTFFLNDVSSFAERVADVNGATAGDVSGNTSGDDTLPSKVHFIFADPPYHYFGDDKVKGTLQDIMAVAKLEACKSAIVCIEVPTTFLAASSAFLAEVVSAQFEIILQKKSSKKTSLIFLKQL